MINFCSHCGQKTEQKIPENDSRERAVCCSCATIHYINPKIICGALVIWQDKILLCKRAIEPSYGLWTLPAGFMEVDESVEQGAMRETWEEAEAKINIKQLYCIYSIPHIGQVYMLYKADLIDGQFGAGIESLESQLFSEDEIPWDELAFPSVITTLKHYFADRKNGIFPLHSETLTPKQA